MLVDLRPKQINGKQAQEVGSCRITVNKNAIPFDIIFKPGGINEAPAVTTRGMRRNARIADLVAGRCRIAMCALERVRGKVRD